MSIFKRSRHRVDPFTDLDTEHVNPVATAREVGSAPFEFDDDRMHPDCDLVSPVSPWESHRAVGLGEAAGKTVMGAGLDGEIKSARAEARWGFEMVAQLTKARLRCEIDHAASAELMSAIDDTPISDIAPFRRRLSKLAKAVMFVGDTAVIGYVFWKAGSPPWLSPLIGATGAASVVALGSAFGHRRAAADQREERGDPPEGCPSLLTGLFREPPPADLGSEEDWVPTRPERPWLAFMGGVALILLTALTLIGAGTDESGMLALGAAMLAALTLPGSAAAEAYGTNEAADVRRRVVLRHERNTAALERFASLSAEAARHDERANLAFTALVSSAASTASVVRWEAGREPDNMRVFGVDRPDTVPELGAIAPDFGISLPPLVGSGRDPEPDDHTQASAGVRDSETPRNDGLADDVGGTSEPDEDAEAA